jgi:hypothetical protein
MIRLSGNFRRTVVWATLAVAVIALPLSTHAAQPKGKIVCWKDKSGRVMGCGDTVPPEYNDNASKELDKRGMTRKTHESAADANARREKERASAKEKATEERRVADGERRDKALLNTYTNETEVDLKRDRELKDIDQNITQQREALKVVTGRLADAQKRKHKEDIARAERSKGTLEKTIADKEAQKEAVTKKYTEEKKRYMELRGIPQPTAGTPSSTNSPTSPTATPVKK